MDERQRPGVTAPRPASGRGSGGGGERRVEAARGPGGGGGPGDRAVQGPDAVPVTLKVNGAAKGLRVEPRETLLAVLRLPLDLDRRQARVRPRRVRRVHGAGSTASRSTRARCSRSTCEGREVTTVEGLGDAGERCTPCRRRSSREDALQCGFCTPGHGDVVRVRA